MLFGVPEGSVLDLLLTFCTQVSWPLLTPFALSTCTNMLMIYRFTSENQPGMMRQLSDVSLSVSSTSTLSWRSAAPNEPHQDPGDVVVFATTAGQGECVRSFGGIVKYQCLRDTTEPGASSSTVSWCCLHKWSPYVALLRWIQLAMAAHAIWCCNDVDPSTISRRLDYCYLLLNSISDGLMTRLQSIQNADCVTHVLLGTPLYDQITPMLPRLQWLPVQKRVNFKMATLVYRLLSRMVLTVSCHLRRFVISCVPPTKGLVSPGRPIATLVIDISWMMAKGLIKLVLDKRTLAMNNLSSC